MIRCRTKGRTREKRHRNKVLIKPDAFGNEKVTNKAEKEIISYLSKNWENRKITAEKIKRLRKKIPPNELARILKNITGILN